MQVGIGPRAVRRAQLEDSAGVESALVEGRSVQISGNVHRQSAEGTDPVLLERVDNLQVPAATCGRQFENRSVAKFSARASGAKKVSVVAAKQVARVEESVIEVENVGDGPAEQTSWGELIDGSVVVCSSRGGDAKQVAAGIEGQGSMPAVGRRWLYRNCR